MVHPEVINYLEGRRDTHFPIPPHGLISQTDDADDEHIDEVTTTLVIDLNGSLESKVSYCLDDGEGTTDSITVDYRPSPQLNPRPVPFPGPGQTQHYNLPDWLPGDVPWWHEFASEFNNFVEIFFKNGSWGTKHAWGCLYCVGILFTVIGVPILSSKNNWLILVILYVIWVLLGVAAFAWPWCWWRRRGQPMLKSLFKKYNCKPETNGRVQLSMPVEEVAFSKDFPPLTVRVRRIKKSYTHYENRDAELD